MIDVPRDAVTVTPRIGISRSADWPLRWFVSDSPFVSKTPARFRPTSAPIADRVECEEPALGRRGLFVVSRTRIAVSPC